MKIDMGRNGSRSKLCIPIRCHVIDPPYDPSHFSATTEDISITGMQALLPHSLPAGTSLKIEADMIINHHKHPFLAVGKVLRTHPVKSHVFPKLYPTAIRFVSFRKGGPELIGPLMEAHHHSPTVPTIKI